MKLVEIGIDGHSLQACAELLQTTFGDSSHHTARYLQWLYIDNPAGRVVGFNAWEGDNIIGHYACIPVDMWLQGQACKGLLALHTAMHPDYRNAGIIYSLAKKTCKLAADRGFACIYAVANASSTPILVKALDFQSVCQLRAALGVTGLQPDWGAALGRALFRRRWTAVTARWRADNPANASRLLKHDPQAMVFQAKTHIPGILAYGLMPIEPPLPEPSASAAAKNVGQGFKLYLGLLPEGSCRFQGYWHIPERLKPSPLNFVYLPLNAPAPRKLDRDDIILGFHDFDPY